MTDITDLREFYQTPLGITTRSLLCKRVQALWPDLSRETVAALGFSTPLLRPWLDLAKLLVFMPAHQGAAYWPRERANLVAMVPSLDQLPLEDEGVHRVIALHALEEAPDPQAFLQEIWRVLKGNGRVLLLVPHRRGLWAHNDSTPFGNGQPYSTGQLRKLFKNEGFVINRIQGALYMPPTCSRLLHRASEKLETIVAPLFPSLGGLLMVEATKQTFEPLTIRVHEKRFRFRFPAFPVSGPLPT